MINKSTINIHKALASELSDYGDQVIIAVRLYGALQELAVLRSINNAKSVKELISKAVNYTINLESNDFDLIVMENVLKRARRLTFFVSYDCAHKVVIRCEWLSAGGKRLAVLNAAINRYFGVYISCVGCR